MNIYAILISKPHNYHYLCKYIRFIAACQVKNVNFCGYTEKHHICPQARDMFPQFKCLKNNPWNCVQLTSRQHFVAHLMLYKTYNNISTTKAVVIMSKNYTIKNSRLFQIARDKLSEIVSNQMTGTTTIRKADGTCMRVDKNVFETNNDIHGSTKGMTYAIDEHGNGFYVKKDDPRFKDGTLKGNNAGTIYITNGKINKRIKSKQDIPRGWYRGMTKNSAKGSFWINNGLESRMIKGNIPLGWERGRYFNKTPTRGRGMTDKIIINNGVINKSIHKNSPIPNGWVKGRIPVKKIL